MQILTKPGPEALSAFRLDRLLREIKARVSGVDAVMARYIHFVELSAPLADADAGVLDSLLDYGHSRVPVTAGTQTLLVVPRPGTISPWSSKASDIARICGLEAVVRIERGIEYRWVSESEVSGSQRELLLPLLHDRMIEAVCAGTDDVQRLFASHAPEPLRTVPVTTQGRTALEAANAELGLALSADEIGYLVAGFNRLGRDPTDAELMMFAQVNSEHCRHKIFNASWTIDGESRPDSLFDLIRSTFRENPAGVLSAYKDNAAVFEGAPATRLVVDANDQTYRLVSEPVHTLIKVETHNHPTAISPFPGAATGSGGEIRDEGATGRGGRPKAGLTGFSVSHLRLPERQEPWESSFGAPDRLASPLQIMLEGPIGGAAFNNEFGRPNVLGYFRTFEQPLSDAPTQAWGYHKPIMIAGGLGSIRGEDVDKPDVPPGAMLVVLGGPAMLIGLGGGAASSMGSGTSSESLDFASVQRGNPEMQRRAQQVIDACWSMGMTGGENPIVIIHDVGAGGLSNAVPELVDHSHRGSRIDIRNVPSAEPGMSPLEIWCNEAQERYVLAVSKAQLAWFDQVCLRERCPYAVLGEFDDSGTLCVDDSLLGQPVVDMPLEFLLGKPPATVMNITRERQPPRQAAFDSIDLADACERVLRFPTVADKSFLIHIGDRTVGGLVARDQLVGPWQEPVSDVAVTALDFEGFAGEAMAMGERTPVAVLDPAASGRLAVAEVITNIMAADIASLDTVRLSANWMAASGVPGEDEGLFDTVDAVAALCRALRIAIPVGKDSLSMQTRWSDAAGEKAVVAPVSLIVTGFAPVADIRKTLTPQLQPRDDASLFLIDLGSGRNRLGASTLAQVFGIDGGYPADLDEPATLVALFAAVQTARAAGLLLAAHDRSDGGLFTTVCEMAFAGRTGLELALDSASGDPLAFLFNEEPGLVVQVADEHETAFRDILDQRGLTEHLVRIGRAPAGERIVLAGAADYETSRTRLRELWASVTDAMQTLRDNPACAAQAQAARLDGDDPGLSPSLTFDPQHDIAAPYIATGVRPAVAILREQGVNSHNEMAAAFHRAGFQPVDVHMSDLVSGRRGLNEFAGLVACGGFSYGDVLGAGGGWAKSILFNDEVRAEFTTFFERADSFALGVCNGCQMLAALQSIIPGAEGWPTFGQNLSEQFEARLSLVEVMDCRSLFLSGMAGSRLMIATSHGEGRADFAADGDRARLSESGRLTIRYIDNGGQPATNYPANPNGSKGGVAGYCSVDGRVTIMMPHPERVARTVQHSWHPSDWGPDGPWLRMFRNARVWLG